MEQKIIFREMLSEIKALADTRQNRLTREEVDAFFANGHFEAEQMKMIYDYLISQKIEIAGYTPAASDLDAERAHRSGENDSADQEERPERSIEFYLEELEQLNQGNHADELQLFEASAAGDKAARSRLVEAYLPMVCELAGDLEGDVLLAEDLIQEGNIGLLLALDHLEPRESLAAYQAELMNAVNQAMEEAITQQKDMRDMGSGIVSRVNHLNQAIQNLEEELEHKVSVEELSAYLEMPAEEIKDILRMAGGEIEVEGYENS